MAKYQNIPVDDETKEMVIELCELHGMSKRSQGAMVKKLAKAELERLKTAEVSNTGAEKDKVSKTKKPS